MAPEERARAGALVRPATEGGARPGARERPPRAERLLGLGAREPREVAAAIRRPAEPAVEERAEEGHDGPQLLEPHVHARLADPARPEPHDEDTRAVGGGRRRVEPPCVDPHRGVPPRGLLSLPPRAVSSARARD